jgi:colicin import membrane protein
MAAAALHFRDEALAGGLALATHVLFLLLLVFGISWQHKQADTAVIVDLWRDLPSVTPPRVEPQSPPPPEVKPEPPKPAPKVEAKPPPKPEPAPAAKPDIALKEKQDRERRLKEQQAAEEKKKLAAEKAREAELDKKKRAEAEALKQKQAAEAEAQRVAAEQQKARDALAAQQAAAQAKVVEEYKRRISDKIRRFIVLPPNVADNAQVEFEIRVLPGGEVLGARLKRAANSIPAYDAAVERAILRAQPLPIPSDPALMSQFRELNLVFRPKE